MEHPSDNFKSFLLKIISGAAAGSVRIAVFFFFMVLISLSYCFREDVLKRVELYNSQNSAFIYHFNILSVSPGVSAINIPTGANILVEFDDNINMATVTGTSFYITPAVAGTFSYNNQLKTVIFDPTVGFTTSTVYTVHLTTGITNDVGETMASDYSWSFTTAAIQCEIDVLSPLAEVLTGDTYDFGNGVNPATKSEIFTIRNSGTANLTISGTTITGVDSSQFSISSFPVSPVAPGGGTTTFTVVFQPSVAVTPPEIKNAILTISNDDSDESLFVINLKGTALNISEPEIQITYGGAVLVSGSTVVDFGTVAVGDTGSITLVMYNIGTANLSVTGVTIGGNNPEFFSTDLFPTSFTVLAGSTKTFNINFTPAGNGNKKADIIFLNNDTDEPSFIVKVKGRGM